jgi:hypothetical protein
MTEIECAYDTESLGCDNSSLQYKEAFFTKEFVQNLLGNVQYKEGNLVYLDWRT